MDSFGTDMIIWIGIALCEPQSAMFSDMNRAMFSLNRLTPEIEVASGNKAAASVLAMRADSNGLLTTIPWGNVGVNVLLTLLSDSVLAGFAAFAFLTFVITIFREVVPQAYFSRNALRVAALLSPVLRVCKILLYPLAKPSALFLDRWLGRKGVHYLWARNLRELLRKHIGSPEAADVDRLERLGALNFPSLDDLPMVKKGERIDPDNVLYLPSGPDGPVFQAFEEAPDGPFPKTIAASGQATNPLRHRPIVMRSPATPTEWPCRACGFGRRRHRTRRWSMT